jgi:hypothetical protein
VRLAGHLINVIFFPVQSTNVIFSCVRISTGWEESNGKHILAHCHLGNPCGLGDTVFFVCVYLEGCMVHHLPYVSCILKNRATFLHVADDESRDSYH